MTVPLSTQAPLRRLNVRVNEASDLYNRRICGSMSPYVVLAIGNAEHRTKAATKQGQYPKWFQDFNFEYRNEQVLYVKLCESGLFSDSKYISEGKFALDTVPSNLFTTDIELKRHPKGKKAKRSGTLSVTIEMIGFDDLFQKDSASTPPAASAPVAPPAHIAMAPVAHAAAHHVWQFKMSDRWKDMQPETCLQLETAYNAFLRGGPDDVAVGHGQNSYTVRFSAMTQSNGRTGRVRSIRRT